MSAVTKAEKAELRAILVCCQHPSHEISDDPVAHEAKETLRRLHSMLTGAYHLAEEQVHVFLDGASPDQLLLELAKPGDVLLWACGHGGRHTRLDEGYETRHRRGVAVPTPKRAEAARSGEQEDVWLPLPGGRLHARALRACLAARRDCTLLFLGACYSGGFFSGWLPCIDGDEELDMELGATAPADTSCRVLALTSADEFCQAGSWLWHEALRHMHSPVAAQWCFRALVHRLRSLHPATTWVSEDARGEAADAASVCLWGDEAESMKWSFAQFLQTQPKTLPMDRRTAITSPPLRPGLAEGHEVATILQLRSNEDACISFVRNLRDHGFTLLDIGSDCYDQFVAPMLRDAREFLGRGVDEDSKLDVFDRVLDSSDQNTNCGWAVAPGTWEMYKFVYSGGCCMENPHYPWPSHPRTFAQSATAYYECMASLTRELVMILADNIDSDDGGDAQKWAELLDPDPVPPGYYSNGDCRFFRYYGESELSESLFQGEVHADLGLLAVGPLSDVDGIHFFDRCELVWRAPEQDESLRERPLLAVWPGDLVRCLTGGRIAAGVHRVKLSPGSADRFSMPFFIRARRNVEIRSLARGAEEEHYQSYADYEERRFRYTQAAGDRFYYVPPF